MNYVPAEFISVPLDVVLTAEQHLENDAICTQVPELRERLLAIEAKVTVGAVNE